MADEDEQSVADLRDEARKALLQVIIQNAGTPAIVHPAAEGYAWVTNAGIRRSS